MVPQTVARAFFVLVVALCSLVQSCWALEFDSPRPSASAPKRWKMHNLGDDEWNEFKRKEGLPAHIKKPSLSAKRKHQYWTKLHAGMDKVKRMRYRLGKELWGDQWEWGGLVTNGTDSHVSPSLLETSSQERKGIEFKLGGCEAGDYKDILNKEAKETSLAASDKQIATVSGEFSDIQSEYQLVAEVEFPFPAVPGATLTGYLTINVARQNDASGKSKGIVMKVELAVDIFWELGLFQLGFSIAGSASLRVAGAADPIDLLFMMFASMRGGDEDDEESEKEMIEALEDLAKGPSKLGNLFGAFADDFPGTARFGQIMKALQGVRKNLRAGEGGDPLPHAKKLLSQIKCDFIKAKHPDAAKRPDAFKTWWIDDRPSGPTATTWPPGALCGPNLGCDGYGLFDNLGMDIFDSFFNAHTSEAWQKKMDKLCPSKEALKECQDNPESKSCEDSPSSGKCVKSEGTGIDPLVKHWSKIFVHHTFADSKASCVEPLSKIVAGELKGDAGVSAITKCIDKIGKLLKMKKKDCKKKGPKRHRRRLLAALKKDTPEECKKKDDYDTDDNDDVNSVIDGLVEEWGKKYIEALKKALREPALNGKDCAQAMKDPKLQKDAEDENDKKQFEACKGVTKLEWTLMGSIGLFGAVEVEKAGVSFEGHASITAGGSFSGSISTGPNAHLEKATPITAGTFVTIAGEAELGKGDPEALPEAAKNFIPGFVSSVLLAFSFDVSWDAKGRKEGTGFALDFGVTPSVLEGAGFTKSVGFFGVQFMQEFLMSITEHEDLGSAMYCVYKSAEDDAKFKTDQEAAKKAVEEECSKYKKKRSQGGTFKTMAYRRCFKKHNTQAKPLKDKGFFASLGKTVNKIKRAVKGLAYALGLIAAENTLVVGTHVISQAIAQTPAWPMALNTKAEFILGMKWNYGEHCFDSVDNVGGGFECGATADDSHFTWTFKCLNTLECCSPSQTGESSWISSAFRLFHTAAKGELELKNGVSITKKYQSFAGKTVKLCGPEPEEPEPPAETKDGPANLNP